MIFKACFSRRAFFGGRRVKVWRLILDENRRGAENMARDEAIVRSVANGESLPTLRLYGWSEPTVSIGCFQNSGFFKARGVPYVRRVTGGRAVLHDDELTYSVACGSAHPIFFSGIAGAYSAISGCVAKALADIGVKTAFSEGRRYKESRSKDFCFHASSRREILAENGRKLVGSSQRRFKDAFLQHGSVIFGVDQRLFESVFGNDAVLKVAWVGMYSDATTEEFSRILARRMEEGLRVRFEQSGLTGKERLLEIAIAGTRYGLPGWNEAGGEADVEKNRDFL